MILSFSELKDIRTKHPDQTIVLVRGVFDLLHRGHVEYLKAVKEHGDVLVVAVSSDKRTKERKGSDRPIHSEEDRVHMIDALRHVDYAFVAPSQQDATVPAGIQMIQDLRPDVFVTINREWLEHKETFDTIGVRLVILPIDKINSTTSIIERIRAAG